MSYVLEPRSESELFELEDSEDQDYVPGVADRLRKMLNYTWTEKKTQRLQMIMKGQGGGRRRGGGRELKLIIKLNILQMLTVMMRMTK